MSSCRDSWKTASKQKTARGLWVRTVQLRGADKTWLQDLNTISCSASQCIGSATAVLFATDTNRHLWLTVFAYKLGQTFVAAKEGAKIPWLLHCRQHMKLP